MSNTSTTTEGEGATTGDEDGEVVLEARGLKKHYATGGSVLDSLLGRSGGAVHAVDGVSFAIQGTETLGLVGESGCGKSTLARTLARLESPTAGEVYFRGENITEKSERSLRLYRSEIQFIHQDPSSSLNPRKTVQQILSRPLELHTDLSTDEQIERIEELLKRVGLDPRQRQRYPHAFSGGQRQRIEIARALSLNPSVVIADEPTSALDVTVQAQILQLLEKLQTEFELSMLFISHDLRTIRYVADRVSVMYLGEMVETGTTDEIFDNARHPYTQSLLSSMPSIESHQSRSVSLRGEPTDPIDPPSGCRFHTRCPVAQEVCSTEPTVEHSISDTHSHRCHFSDANISEETASVRASHENGT